MHSLDTLTSDFDAEWYGEVSGGDWGVGPGGVLAVPWRSPGGFPGGFLAASWRSPGGFPGGLLAVPWRSPGGLPGGFPEA